MLSLLKKLNRQASRHGWKNTFQGVVLKALVSIFGIRILRGVFVAPPDENFLKCPNHLRAGFLARKELRKYCHDQEAQMSEKFVNGALAGGDHCYAIRDGDVLAAYGWYSLGSTPIDMPNFVISFSEDYVYMYKAFTNPKYRGQRLHAVGVTGALPRYLSQGYKGLVSYVDASNFDSLKSCLRMGSQVFGSIYVMQWFGHSFAIASPGCRRFKFRLDRIAEPNRSVTLAKS